MTRFSPSDAAMEGFRLTKEHPGVMLAWSAVYFGGILLIAMVMMASLGPQFISMIQKGQLSSPDDLDNVAGMLAQSWPAFLIVLLMTALLMSIITGGVMRLVLRPGEHGFAHLRISRTELKLTAANLLCIGIGALSMIVGLVFTTGAAQMGSVGASLAVGLFLAFVIWIGVRLSLLLPTVFETGQVSLRLAWNRTKGHFWQLFGMIVLAVIFYVIVWILFSIISFAVVELSGGEAAIQDIGRLTPLTAIAAMITLVMQLLLQVLQIVMIYAPFAVAYRELVLEDAPPPAAEAV
ncbi:MAG TPA: hypothetical protein VJU34_04480 [Phenylobacterium sp.]|nr:hypothetical protein [Phenylobacterium sp.]